MSNFAKIVVYYLLFGLVGWVASGFLEFWWDAARTIFVLIWMLTPIFYILYRNRKKGVPEGGRNVSNKRNKRTPPSIAIIVMCILSILLR